MISSLQSNGVTIAIVGHECSMKVKFIRSMNDGKMQKLLLGTGAFCVLCLYPDEDAILAELIVEGFEIGEVDVESLRALYDDLEVDGEVQTLRADLSWSNTKPYYSFQCEYISNSACIVTWSGLLPEVGVQVKCWGG